MAYFTSLWQSRIIESHRLEYENEKFSSLLISNTEIPRKTVMQRWRLYGHHTKRRMTGRLKKWFPKGSSVSNLYYYLKTDQTFPNFVLKSIIGFLGGIVLTYLCFMFFVFQLSISLIHATIMSSIVGVLLTLGLAFSYRIRCLVFLLIPQFFSRVGRYTLTCYALILILTGPATNTLRNFEVLSESMACSQEQIKSSVRLITEAIKTPFSSMKGSIKLMVDKIKKVTSRIDDVVSKIGVLVTSIGDEIQSSLDWLSYVVDVCNRKFGTPNDYCVKVMGTGLDHCKEYLDKDSLDNWNKSLVESACSAVKKYESICIVSDYAKTSFAATLRRRLRIFTARITETFFVDIETHHTHSFSNNSSASANQVAAGIVTEIRNRADPLLTWLSWSSCVTSLFLLLIIFRAKYYQQMYETRSRFDNRYVTKELGELDFKRYMDGRETVLPLNRRERAKYISIMSYRLIATEKIYLTRSIVFMTITTFKLLIHMVADYSLYWILMTIRYHGRFQSQIPPGPSDGGVHISGTGFVSDLIRSLFDAMTTPLTSHLPSPVTCLPNPHPPDFKRYTQIVVLILLLWFFSLLEPYGLRLRHVIMGHYRPERAKARAVWLYNHILRTRASFMKLARRKLHREYKYASQENMTLRHLINSYIPWRCFKYFLKKLPNSPQCLLCNTLEDLKDADTKLISCETNRCPGVYCLSCFSDIGKLCTICLSPADYGDMSDVSLENGSSDDSSDSEGNRDDLRLNRINNDERTALIRKTKENYKELNIYKNKGGQYDACNFSSGDETYTKYLNPTLNYYYSQDYVKDIKTDDDIKNENSNKDVIGEVNHYEHRKRKSFKTLTRKRSVSRNQRHKNRRKVPRHYKKLRFKNVNQTILCRLLLRVTQFLKINSCRFCMNIYDVRRKARYIEINKKTHTRKINKNVPKNWKSVKRCKTGIKIIRRSPSLKVLYIKHSKLSNVVNGSLFVNSSNKIDITQKQNKGGEAKKNKNKKSKNAPKEGKNGADKDNGCRSVKKMCKICSSCFTYIKLGVTPSKQMLRHLKNNKEPYTSNKSNFKRRKKDGNRLKAGNDKMDECESTRNYRISTYLFENCWIKDRNDKGNRNERMLQVAAVKTDKDREFSNKNPMKSCKCLCNFNDCTCTRKADSFGKKRLSSFRKRIYCSNDAKKSNPLLKTDDGRDKNSKLHPNPVDPNITRRMDYYRSLGITDFVDPSDKPNQEFPHQNNVPAEMPKKLSTENSPASNQSKANFEFDRLSTSLKSFKIKELKLGISERFLHLRIRNPFPVMRDLYAHILETTKKEKRSQQKITVEKGVLALPAVESQSCQCDCKINKVVNRTTQIHGRNKVIKPRVLISQKQTTDVAIDVKQTTCTCATQYQATKEDKCCSCIQINVKGGDTANVDETPESLISESTESLCSQSEGTKTDTTICSRVAINYEETPRVRNKAGRRVHVVTKANQATTTDKAEVCDVSTLTNDWWSPIEERKVAKQNKYREASRKKTPCTKHKGISTGDGRIVKFKSEAQIIPSDSEDILSPSRYLLESQRYYNELFSSKIYSPRVFPAIFLKAKKCGKSISSKDSIMTLRKCNIKSKGKPKRLDKRGSLSFKPKIGRARSDESSFER
ncbi:uncharacterized protein LOC116774821 isoform X2 [Danaus plexippus]|uniref:uncharacterized protein LOC116774821 isoform X2 n=1 Tax=Danaus plexippus TaxID=13037 RepID=UPI002AB0C7A3|nr:uncharacterized protein LOC116774821 isoform X2 [Danaus plexippus]